MALETHLFPGFLPTYTKKATSGLAAAPPRSTRTAVNSVVTRINRSTYIRLAALTLAAMAAAFRALGPPVVVRSVLASARLPWLDMALRLASATARELLPDWEAGAA